MSARIDICNIALTWLGADHITSIEDEAIEARMLKANYYLARDATLEAHEWSFAIKRFIPTRTVADPVWGAANRFSVPSDIIRVLRVEAGGGILGGYDSLHSIDRRPEADWLIESGYIITNADAIVCKAIRRIEDEGIYSPLFVHAFAAHLAMLMAYPLTESDTKFRAMSALYTLKLKDAKSRDGLQGSSKRIRNRTLQNVR